MRGMYPRRGLGQAIAVTEAAAAVAAGDDWCLRSAVAEHMGRTPDSQTFRLQIAAAHLFGLVSKDRLRLGITSLGAAVLDPQRAPQARIEAFMRVELYARVCSDLAGVNLPNRSGLAIYMMRGGIPKSSTREAVTAFLQSARTAGLLTDNQLSRPAAAATEPQAASPRWEALGIEALEALWRMLPAEQFETPQQRQRWWTAFVAVFDLVYGTDDAEAAVEDDTAPAGDLAAAGPADGDAEPPKLQAVVG